MDTDERQSRKQKFQLSAFPVSVFPHLCSSASICGFNFGHKRRKTTDERRWTQMKDKVESRNFSFQRSRFLFFPICVHLRPSVVSISDTTRGKPQMNADGHR